MRRRRSVEPYLQGDLDALCGIYAIINAVQLCLRSKRYHYGFCADLFDDLVKAGEVNAARYLIQGLNVRDLAQLLRVAADSVRQRISLTMTISRPFADTEKLPQADYLDRLDKQLKQIDRSVIIALGHRNFRYHWTILQTITSRSLRLADSCEDRVVRRSSLRMSGPRKTKRRQRWMPQHTFVITIQ